MSSDSDRPTLQPQKKRENRLAKFKDALALIGTAAALLSTAAGVAWAWFDRLATDQEVTRGLSTHDQSATAHARLRDRLASLEAAAGLHSVERAQLTELWRWQVGYVAADREDDRRLRAAAASYYREVFDRMVGEGVPANRAFREALREPWYDRPKIR